MKRVSLAMVVLLALTLGAGVVASEAAGPPKPVPYKAIPDPADDVERHIVVKAEDRGDVWLLTGMLDRCWDPELDSDMLARLKLRYGRTGFWPFWSPVSITAEARAGGRQHQWGDYRDSAAAMGEMFDRMLELKKTGMTLQMILHHKGPYYGSRRIGDWETEAYGEHIRKIVGYAEHMALPVDYWEVWNEPKPGPYEGTGNPSFWHGTWDEYLAMWDATYDAIRSVKPDAKIAGPSWSGPKIEDLTSFLDHFERKGQRLDVLAWHFPEYAPKEDMVFENYLAQVEPDRAHKTIDNFRKVIAAQYSMLGIKEIHIDEWGCYSVLGPGGQVAMFHYMDLAGVDRAARSDPTSLLNGLMVGPEAPKTTYWAWVEYAKQDGGKRLVSETNDRCVIALASRHDRERIVRAIVARSKRISYSPALPVVKTRVDFEGIPIEGPAEVTIFKLGPNKDLLWEDDLESLYTRKVETVRDGKLTLRLNDVLEEEAYSVTIAPVGTWAKEEAAKEREERKAQFAEDAIEGKPLPYVLLKEGFESGFESAKTILGKNGWTHARNESSYLWAHENAEAAHSGKGYAQFTDNYWSTHDVYRAIEAKPEGVVEATAWFRFTGYEGNKNGKGYAGMVIGLCETPDNKVDKNYLTFKFGTSEQAGYSPVIFNNDGLRVINRRSSSGLRKDVRNKWYQVGVLLDMESRTVTARYRQSEQDRWIVLYKDTFEQMNWTPRYVKVSGYNQAPDWHLAVDDIEVRSSVGD